ncbi:hypothetical protein Tco_0453430 [Tanacetum coccineum]
MTNDQANYYSVITSITVNGKNAYELKEKFLDDLHKNSFSGTNREDAVEHIEYFLKIVDLIDLPNVNRDKLGVVVFLISLVGDAWRWFDGIKGSITSWVDLTDNFFRKYYPLSCTSKINTPITKWDPTNLKFENRLTSKFVNYKMMDIFTKGALLDYWKLGSDEIEPTNEEPSDLEETDHDDEQEINEIFRIETNLFDYETPLDTGVWTEATPIVHYSKPFNYKTGCSEWPTYSWREDGYCNGGNLPGAYIVGNTLCYQYLEWYDALKDSELKEEAVRNKAIMEGLIDEDVEPNYEGWKSWDDFENTNGDRKEREWELFDNHKLSVCKIRRFKMIKYSFRDDEEYVIVKEDEHDNLTSTSKYA